MKIFAYCIVSHERPEYLEQHLASVCSALSSYDSLVTIYIFDNSTEPNASLVRSLALRYKTLLIQNPGASSFENFNIIADIEVHHFCMIAHDDDICYFYDPSSLFSQLGNSLDNFITFIAPTLYIDDQKKKVCLSNQLLLLPVCRSLYPWRMPAFPSWIYPMNDSFLDLFKKFFVTRPAGKYSDVVFLDKFCSTVAENNPSRIVSALGVVYIYRRHSQQDSSSLALSSYLQMLFLVKGVYRAAPLLLPLDIIKKLIGACARCKFRPSARS
jgi:hypothetical protein